MQFHRNRFGGDGCVDASETPHMMGRSLDLKHGLKALLASVSSLALLTSVVVPPAYAQSAPPQHQGVAPQPLRQGQLQQIVAPIALYPDNLLTQVLMASTYPLDIVQAARWRRANSKLKDEQLEVALKDRPWDESVKALAAVPDVLHMLSDKLEWTQQLGEAFLAQEEDLMSAVQDLRRRADAAGNLTSSKHQRVTRTGGSTPNVVIESAEPDVIYVPSYQPGIYGAWGYPEYPPYDWYPRPAGISSFIWWATAVAAGTALWASWDWNRRRVVVDPVRYNRFNKTTVAPQNWQFDPTRRRGASFNNPALAAKYKDAGVPAIRREAIGKAVPNVAGKPGGAGMKGVPGVKTPTVTGPTAKPAISGPKPAAKSVSMAAATAKVNKPVAKATLKAPARQPTANAPKRITTSPKPQMKAAAMNRAPAARTHVSRPVAAARAAPSRGGGSRRR